MFSLLVYPLLSIVAVIAIMSVLAKRLVWRDVNVYAAIAGGCVWLVAIVLTGSSMLAMIAWVAGWLGFFYYYQNRSGRRL